MNLGEKLRKLRLKTKKTLKETSKMLNVSLNTVYRWEHGLSTPRKSVLKKAAGYYSVPLEWLLGEDGGEDEIKGGERIMDIESDIELKILATLKILPEHSKHRVLGYIECMFDEDEGL